MVRRTLVVTRYDTYASFVPSFSFNGFSTVHSRTPSPTPARSIPSACSPAWCSSVLRLPLAERVGSVLSTGLAVGIWSCGCSTSSRCQETLSNWLPSSIILVNVPSVCGHWLGPEEAIGGLVAAMLCRKVRDLQLRRKMPSSYPPRNGRFGIE